MDKKTNITYLIDSLFPDHVAANYPRLIEFAKIFFQYLNEENKSSYYQNTLYLQRDLREQDPEFAEYIKRELGILTKSDYAADPKIFYDNIVQIWQSKGSEESIKSFFRIFLGDEVTIYYPWESVLIPSDGRWIVNTVIRVIGLLGNPTEFAGKRITQINSNATAIVDRVERKIYSDVIIYELHLIPSTISGTFLQRNTIYADETLTAEVYRSANGLVITNTGSGYKVGDKIVIDGYEGLGFTAFVQSINSDGGILSVAINDFGSGNTPLSEIVENTTKPYYLIDFLFYEQPDPEDLHNLITQVGAAPFTVYSLNRSAAVLASDYDLLHPAELTFVVESENGIGAEFTIRYGALATYPGYYEGVKGQLSESIVLQDSKYYQKFSYEVRTIFTTERWIQPLKKFAHPAGVEVVGNVYSFSEFKTGIKDYFLSVGILDEPTYTFTESPGITVGSVGFTQDYFEVDAIYFAEDYFANKAFNTQSIIAGINTQEASTGLTTP
jgi:hypothetical protein